MARGARRTQKKRISLRDIAALQPNTIIWDSTVTGFGARRQQGDAVSYILKFRTKDGRQHKVTIGRHGAPWTPDEARAEAQRLLGEVVIKGKSPTAAKLRVRTIAELCDAYVKDSSPTLRRSKKASTLVTDASRIERHIKPLIGRRLVEQVTRQDIENFMNDVARGKTAKVEKTNKLRGKSVVRGGIGTASRTVGLLGGIFTYAQRLGLRPDNPVHGVLRPPDQRRMRRLSDEEYKALGTALSRNDVWPPALRAIRFLALTGWRRSEAALLRWEEVNLERRTVTLGDTKTGFSVRPLSQAARDTLGSQGEGLVFLPARGDSVSLQNYWEKFGMPRGVTLHTLRHSFASLAADLGFSEPTIGALLGHRSASVTSRYVHFADTVLIAAADAVADETVNRLGS
jgi:integrase